MREIEILARRLLACEAAADHAAVRDGAAAFGVCEKLSGPLGKVMGSGGYRALLSRAQALAGAEVPLLRTLQINLDGSLEVPGEPATPLDARALADAEAALLAQLLGLLHTFIGAALTAELLQEIWPRLNDLNSRTGESL